MKTESKHTPGPWIVEQYSREYKERRCYHPKHGHAPHNCGLDEAHPIEAINIFNNQLAVAKVLFHGWDETEANAKLIAKAPAMFEALKLIADAETHLIQGAPMQLEAVVKVARKALEE